jgi:hypothetical protein
MKNRILAAGALVGALILPVAALAQSGAAVGATTGAVGGLVVGGPIGAVVGGVGGAIIGGISDDSRPRFRTYVTEQRRPSYQYRSDVVVGAELPEAGVTYYDVPREYGETQYRYTVVNNRTVLVDPRTRRVIQVIE